MRVMSVQKLPTVPVPAPVPVPVPEGANPRINANATAMPVAADRKFCTVSPAIWVKFDMAASPL